MRWFRAPGVVSSAALVLVLFAAVGAGATPDASTDNVDDPEAWLSARGVKDPSKELGDVCCCVEVIVGSAAERALRCGEAIPIGDEGADIVAREVIRVVRAGKAVKVLDVWTTLENLDLPPRSLPMLELRLTTDRSRRTATIIDPGGNRNRCDDLPRRTTDTTATDRLFRKWMHRICDSRGTYRWRGGRFVRASR